MKKIIPTIILGIIVLTGCSSSEKTMENQNWNTDKYIVNTMDLSDLPVHTSEYIDEGNGQRYTRETVGQLIDYDVLNEEIYYLVEYDYNYDYCSEVGICKQDFQSGTMREIFYNSEMKPLNYVSNSLSISDNTISWKGKGEDGKLYICTLEDGNVTVEKSTEKATVDTPCEKLLEKYFIEESYIGECNRLVGKNDNFIVWEQWHEGEYFNDSFINIYDINRGTVFQILKEDFGIVHPPVMYNNYLCIHTIDDIKTYTSESDFYSAVYLWDMINNTYVNIAQGEGNTDSIARVFFDEPLQKTSGILFVARKRTENDATDVYSKMYYIH